MGRDMMECVDSNSPILSGLPGGMGLSCSDMMPVITFTKDLDSGKYLSCSRSFVDFLQKLTSENIIGHDAGEVFGREIAADFVQSDTEAANSDAPVSSFVNITDVNGSPHYFQSTKMKTIDSSGRQCILGINIDISEVVQIQYKWTNRDDLTGVKNKQAYAEFEEELNQMIRTGGAVEFSVCVFDINDLASVNANSGRQAGDELLRMVSTVICDVFVHSPVFRLDDDEFTVISRGQDYEQISGLFAELELFSRQNRKRKGIVINSGMARYNGEKTAAEVYEKAVRQMRENKKNL
ncbi:MAG: diguanylate cyclase [Anaerolineaceae bacterium]|nr:diguanylate cyclase [Anaerolineaceae bacterium]